MYSVVCFHRGEKGGPNQCRLDGELGRLDGTENGTHLVRPIATAYYRPSVLILDGRPAQVGQITGDAFFGQLVN